MEKIEMNMAEILETVRKNSHYLTTLSYSELIANAKREEYNAIAIIDNKIKNSKKKQILIFCGGTAEGAVEFDEHGIIFGDRVLYSLNGNENFQVFITERELVDSLASRARIYNTESVGPQKLSSDIHDIKSFSTRPAKVRISVNEDGVKMAGYKVVLRRENNPAKIDYTSQDGSVGFILSAGEYICTVIDKNKTEHHYKLNLDGRPSEISLKISTQSQTESLDSCRSERGIQ